MEPTALSSFLLDEDINPSLIVLECLVLDYIIPKSFLPSSSETTTVSAILKSAFEQNNQLQSNSSVKPNKKIMSLIPRVLGGPVTNVSDPLSRDLWDPFEQCPFISSLLSGPRTNTFDPLSLDIWDPFQRCPFISSVFSNAQTSALITPPTDWKETQEADIFKVDLPGLKKEEVKVEVGDDNILQISGERSREQEEKNDKWHQMERSFGKFLRRFQLPENVKIDQAKASMENGVLIVNVPKEVVKKLEIKPIEISG